MPGEVRIARLDDHAPPSAAAPVARFGEAGADDDVSGEGGGSRGWSGAGDDVPPAVAALADAGGPAEPEPAADVGAMAGSAGSAAAAGRVPAGAQEPDAGPGAPPVADLGEARGKHAADAPTARLHGAGSHRTHDETLLIVPHEPDPAGPGHRPDDQQRRRRGGPGGGGGRGGPGLNGSAGRSGESGRGDDSDQRPTREAPSRRGGPKQIDPDADPVAVAREVCLRLLTDRARTRHELAQALRQRGVPDEAAGSVLERFDEVGLIDDAAFAGQWVRSRHHHRGLARRAIAMELRRKGVDGEVAEEALGEVDADAESRRARELVDRKLRSLTADSPEQRTAAARRLVGMLARKGYGAGTAYRVVREALAAHGADADELGSEPSDD